MTEPTARAVLVDGNVLVALVVDDHVHHARARRWFADGVRPFLTCPITQGTLLRVSLHQGATIESASETLAGLTRHPRHRFVPDTLSYLDVGLGGVIGHRQITDAYLVALAERHGAVVATFDRGLAALRPSMTELVGAV